MFIQKMTLDFYELTKGAPGYGNKAVPSLDFGALTLSDNLIQGWLHFSSMRRGRDEDLFSPTFLTYKCNGSR